MNRDEAVRLARKAQALRAKAVYESDTGERVPEPEREALESKAKELEDRVKTEYQEDPVGAFTFTTPPYVHGPRSPRTSTNDTRLRDWCDWWEAAGEHGYQTSSRVWSNSNFNHTTSDEYIEDDYLWAPNIDEEEGDY